jgi:hypothetical protein
LREIRDAVEDSVADLAVVLQRLPRRVGEDPVLHVRTGRDVADVAAERDDDVCVIGVPGRERDAGAVAQRQPLFGECLHGGGIGRVGRRGPCRRDLEPVAGDLFQVGLGHARLTGVVGADEHDLLLVHVGQANRARSA